MLLGHRQGTSLETYLNHLITQMNTVFFSGQTTIDFSTQASLHSLHEFIKNCQVNMPVLELAKEHSDKLSEALIFSYVNIVEVLVFKSGRVNKIPDPGEVELILKVITNFGQEDSFKISLTHRSLLIRIVYRNRPELVSFFFT